MCWRVCWRIESVFGECVGYAVDRKRRVSEAMRRESLFSLKLVLKHSTAKRKNVLSFKGVFLVTTANAILPVDRDYRVNTYL